MRESRIPLSSVFKTYLVHSYFKLVNYEFKKMIEVPNQSKSKEKEGSKEGERERKSPPCF